MLFPADPLIWGITALAIKSIVGLGVLFGVLRLFDVLNGVKFKDALERIRKDPRAESDYYSRRLIAMALVILGISIGSI